MSTIKKGKNNYYMRICDIQASKLVKNATFRIFGVSDPLDPISNTLIFVKNDFNGGKLLNECIIISKEEVSVNKSCIQIITDSPKNSYGRLLDIMQKEILKSSEEECNNSFFRKDTKIGVNTNIGKFCVIEEDVEIGDNCEIGDYVFIGAHSHIGNNVCIKNRSSIGICDADVYREGKECRTLRHLGGTIIEDGCLLLEGAHISAGDTRTTYVSEGTMVGINANVGHNCFIGANTLIGAHACICGQCDIGDGVYIAPTSVVMNRIQVEDKAKVGIGSVVLDNVNKEASVYGNPAMSYWNN